MNALAIYQAPQQAAYDFIPVQAENDRQAINLWLHGKASKTITEYKRDVAAFLLYVDKPLRFITLGDVQVYLDSLTRFKPRTQARKLAAVKSLLSFAQKIGYLRLNVGAAVKAPKCKDDLAQRILSEQEVMTMLALEPNSRNKALLTFLYASGARAAEVAGLSWKDFAETSEGQAVVTLFGKGSKTRYVVIPAGVWQSVQALRKPEDGNEDPVFRSRKRGFLSTVQIWRIVRAAADRAGLGKPVSPHWLRHCCASHALERGCNIAVVSATLGHSSLAVTSVYVHVKPKDSAGLYLALQ